MSDFNNDGLGFRSMAGAWLLVGSLGLLGAAPALAWDWTAGTTVVGSGPISKTQRQLAGFKGVSMEVPATLEIVQGEVEGALIETDDNIASQIETLLEGDQLKIRVVKRFTLLKPTSLKITLNVRSLERVSISGSGKVNIEKLQTPSLETYISGSGDIRIAALTADLLGVAISGNGDLFAAGRADTVKSSISGSGDLKMDNLAAKSVKLSIAGSGSAKLQVSQKLDVNIAGSGDVAYYGDPVVTQSVAGSGRIKRLGARPDQ
jgi:hypothetical protein